MRIGPSSSRHRIVSKLPDDAYRVVRSGVSRLLGALMPFWYIGTLIVLIASAVLSRDVLAIVAVALVAAAVLLSVTVLVPINNRICAWRSEGDVDRELAGRWDRLHWVRVGLLVTTLVALTAGVA